MKYVIIGYGNIGKKRQNALGKKCVTTADPYVEEADYKDYKEVPLDSFDAAVLAIPPEEKIEIVKYLLSNKKHVLSEKPLPFRDKKELDDVRTLAEENNVIWYTSYNHRFEPLIIKLKEILDSDGIGKFYFGKITYGFGTAQNNVDTWRDTDLGVIEEVGSHLVNFVPYLFSKYPNPDGFKIIDASNFETNNSPDNCWFSYLENHLLFHCSWDAWKNVFEIELFGSKGSLHLYGLRKWGESKLFHRERVYPSGVPKEKVFASTGPDVTWEKDIEFFEKMVSQGKTSYDDDLYMLNSMKTITNQLEKKKEAIT